MFKCTFNSVTFSYADQYAPASGRMAVMFDLDKGGQTKLCVENPRKGQLTLRLAIITRRIRSECAGTTNHGEEDGWVLLWDGRAVRLVSTEVVLQVVKREFGGGDLFT